MIDTPTDDIRALRAMLPAPDVATMTDATRARVEDRIRAQRTPHRPVSIASTRTKTTRVRRMRVGALVAAAAAAVAIVPTVLPGGDGNTVGASPAAAQVLDAAAEAAIRTAVSAPRANQWVYVRTLWQYAKPEAGYPAKEERTIWLSQQSDMRNGSTQYSVRGSQVPIWYLDPDDDGRIPADVDRPTYAWLDSLPTDPGDLKDRLVDDLKAKGGYQGDSTLFAGVTSLISENIVPPRTQAALYRVLTLIEGVTTASAVTDAAGRPGIGITAEYDDGGTTDTLVFDRSTHALLGTTSALGSSAVLQRAVVDHRYEQPTR